MSDPYNLQRFVDAQQASFEAALMEIRSGSKQSHWMWYIFPQLAGLGRSPTAEFYGIATLAEGRSYLAHPVLGPRLEECVEALLAWAERRSAEWILGPIDTKKLKSSLTLFDTIEPSGLYARALLAFFGGERDALTLALLNAPL